MTWEDNFVRRVEEIIATYGHAVQYVPEDPGSGYCAFAYTVGLHTGPHTDYELAVSGLGPETSRGVLNSLASALATNGMPPTEALEIDGLLQDGYILRLQSVSRPERFTVIPAIYGGIVPVWQVLWPDRDHRYPGEVGYSLPQQLL